LRVPRYFFHVRDDRESIDTEGTVLSGLEEARVQAVTTSGEMLRDFSRQFWNEPEWRMWVTDETGATVCSLRFSAEDWAPATFTQYGPGESY
jgi:hypothetical protein